MLMMFAAVFRRSNRSRSKFLPAEPALAHIRGERISSWPGENSTPNRIPQGYDFPPSQMTENGPGMAGIGANGPPRDSNAYFPNGPSISHPPASQSRYYHRSRSSGGGRQEGWVDHSVYNGLRY